MKASTLLRVAPLGAGVALCALCGAAFAARDSGDSSMNPFTGDSYAYFHGGHNLGEGAMIRPGGTPPATGWQLYPPTGHAASAPPSEEAAHRAANAAQPTPQAAPPAEAAPPTADAQPAAGSAQSTTEKTAQPTAVFGPDDTHTRMDNEQQ